MPTDLDLGIVHNGSCLMKDPSQEEQPWLHLVDWTLDLIGYFKQIQTGLAKNMIFARSTDMIG